ncbi:hypothetical protein GQ43DRAFT_390586 [Delitschia confertaspora ATCC 74209]|uniref:Aminotransferase, class IV n=1 Tax=Delitschia confertaspora ATCC 74209 TaxID=1513339 RepID=A0A9P4JP82_9PLEO|nr:hypothetical protein GQ43DRAFT_390586 [Delitschia confertaspora ATCC 74209]
MSSISDFKLFTSLRYDPLLLTSEQNSQPNLNFVVPSPFYMLTYHRDRMLEAALHFEFHEVAEKLQDGKALHELLLSKVKAWIENGGKDGPLKLRVLFCPAGELSLDIAPIPPVALSTLYPPSLALPKALSAPHPASRSATPENLNSLPLTGGTLTLGPTDSLPGSSSTSTPSHPAPSNTNTNSNSTTNPTSNPNSSFSPESQPPTWLLRLDHSPTEPTPFTSLKTTHRAPYDTARHRALPTNPTAPLFTEVLLYNPCNELTEGTLTSLYFYRGGRWVTPPVGVPAGEFHGPSIKNLNVNLDGNGSGEDPGTPGEDEGELRKPFPGRWGHSLRSKVGSGGQRGTTRRWALWRGMCMEEPVRVETVRVGELMWVSNGVRGFGLGRVVE